MSKSKIIDTLAVTLVGDTSGTEIGVKELTGEQVLHNGLNLAYFLGGTVAVVVIIIGGIMYATSAGNSGRVTKAKDMLLYAIVGLVIVISAYAITDFVIKRF